MVDLTRLKQQLLDEIVAIEAELATKQEKVRAIETVQELQADSQRSDKSADRSDRAKSKAGHAGSLSRTVLDAVGTEWTPLSKVTETVSVKGFDVTGNKVQIALARWKKRHQIERTGKRGAVRFRRKGL